MSKHAKNCFSCKSSRLDKRQTLNYILNQDIKPFICRQGDREFSTTVKISSYKEAELTCIKHKPRS